MTDTKPLEWNRHTSEGMELGCFMSGNDSGNYAAWPDGEAWYVTREGIKAVGHGSKDGTIETAKQRCEEHRRKVNNVEATN